MAATVIDPDDLDALRDAAEHLRHGATVIAQTDTNYGVFTTPFSRTACERLYAMKRRDGVKPLTLFTSGPDDWTRWARPPVGVDVRALTSRFWPGPLNLIMRKRPVVPGWVTSGGDTVAIVHNESPVVNLLSVFSGLPLAATSANISGTMDTGLVDFDLARSHLGDTGDYIIRSAAPSALTTSSTILSLVSRPTVVRQGDLSVDTIRQVLADLD